MTRGVQAECEPVEETAQGFVISSIFDCRFSIEREGRWHARASNRKSKIANRKSHGGCGSTAECGRAKAETTVRFRSPAPFRGRSSPAERSFDMREAERAARSAPTIFEGIAQSAERVRHVRQVAGAIPSALTSFVPVV